MLPLSSLLNIAPTPSPSSSSVNGAHIIRWDREGAIVTDTFDYNQESHLANFFYRLGRASPVLHGVNTSVMPASAMLLLQGWH